MGKPYMTNPMLLKSKIDYSNSQLLQFLLLSQLVFWLPMIITSLALIYNHSSRCLFANFTCNYDDPTCSTFGLFTLGQWVYMDAYIKMAVLAAIGFCCIIEREVQCKAVLYVIAANLVRFFYLFYFGWVVTASALFWGSNKGFPNQTYTYCNDSPYKGYLFFLLIYSYILIPISLYLTGLRSQDTGKKDTFDAIPDQRRDTQMMAQKPIKQGLMV